MTYCSHIIRQILPLWVTGPYFGIFIGHPFSVGRIQRIFLERIDLHLVYPPSASTPYNTALQSQKAVSAYLWSNLIPPFGFARQKIPRKHETLNQCWFNGPPSTTSAQYWTKIGSMSRVCWNSFPDAGSPNLPYCCFSQPDILPPLPSDNKPTTVYPL